MRLGDCKCMISLLRFYQIEEYGPDLRIFREVREVDATALVKIRHAHEGRVALTATQHVDQHRPIVQVHVDVAVKVAERRVIEVGHREDVDGV